MEPLLQVEDLRIEFRTVRGTLQALGGVSFDVMPGEVFGWSARLAAARR